MDEPTHVPDVPVPDNVPDVPGPGGSADVPEVPEQPDIQEVPDLPSPEGPELVQVVESADSAIATRDPTPDPDVPSKPDLISESRDQRNGTNSQPPPNEHNAQSAYIAPPQSNIGTETNIGSQTSSYRQGHTSDVRGNDADIAAEANKPKHEGSQPDPHDLGAASRPVSGTTEPSNQDYTSTGTETSEPLATGNPEGSSNGDTNPIDAASEPKKFYRWVSMTAEDARSIEQSGGDLDKAFEDKALKGEWFSPEPLGYLESAITMAVASEWTDRAEGTDGLKGETREGIVARCYEFTPPSGTESFEGHARHQGGLGQNPSPDSTGLRRIHADLIGGGTQAFIPRAGVERDAESWGMRRVDQHLPEDLRGTNNTGQERSPVESITPLDDPGPIPYTEFSGIIHKYVQP